MAMPNATTREGIMAELRTRTAEERSIAELFGELSQDVALLVRQEAELAKTEMQQKSEPSVSSPCAGTGETRHASARGASGQVGGNVSG